MMKKLTALLLALTLVLTMLSTAFAWSCPSCGNEMSGKFCTECGTKKPENICPSCGMDYGSNPTKFCTECGTKLTDAAASAATPVPTATPAPTEAPKKGPTFILYPRDDGRLYLIWNADGETEYRIHFFPKWHDRVEEDMTEANLAFGMEYKDSIGIFAFNFMPPGQACWVGVFDAEGNGEYRAYTPELPVPAFDTCEMLPYALPAIHRDGMEDTEVEVFTLADLESGSGVTPGLFLGGIYNNPGEEFEVFIQIVVETPVGDKYVSTADSVTITSDEKNAFGWSFYNLSSDFSYLRKVYGELPTGDYPVSMYLNGKYVGTGSFCVAESAPATATPAPTAVPLTITGFVPNSNGSVDVAWMGGAAPYDVQYCIRMSESVENDAEYAVEKGFLQTEKTGLDATEATLYELIPGEKYWIIVTDKNGQKASQAVKTQVSELTGLKAELIVSSNPVDAEAANVATDFRNGFHMGFVYENPGEARTMLLRCVVDYGNGCKKVTEAGQWQAETGKNCLNLGEYANLDGFKQDMINDAGFELEEDVTLSVYLDNMLAGQAVIPLEANDQLQITGVKSLGNGTVAVTWKGGTAPYDVRYLVKRGEDYNADLTDKTGLGRWMAEDGLTGSSYVLTELEPGVAYWISVHDAEGGWYVPYTPDAAGKYTAMTTSLEVVPKARVDENDTTLDRYPVDTAGLEDETTHGAQIYLHYDNPGETRSVFLQLVMNLPGGTPLVQYGDKVELSAGTQQRIGWEFYNLEWYLNYMRNRYGALPEGDLQFKMYVDGMLAGSATVPLKAAAPVPTAPPGALATSESGVSIMSITENADGSATITWHDAYNKGPYEINYVQKVTDDFMADRNGDYSTGMWYDTKEATGNSYTLMWLVPGQAYWLAVHNAEGNGVYAQYIPAPAAEFTEYPVTLSNQPKLRSSSGDVNVSQFSSAEIGAKLGQHGMYFKVAYPQLARERDYMAMVVITEPGGAVVGVNRNEFHFNSGGASYVYWDFFDLDWYFSTMINAFGSVPTGKYTVDLYLDGKHAGETTFTVTN